MTDYRHPTKVESVLTKTPPPNGGKWQNMCIESQSEEWRHRFHHGIVELGASPNLQYLLFFLYLASSLSKGLGSLFKSTEVVALERNEDSFQKSMSFLREEPLVTPQSTWGTQGSKHCWKQISSNIHDTFKIHSRYLSCFQDFSYFHQMIITSHIHTYMDTLLGVMGMVDYIPKIQAMHLA